jgi:hypothetical protein
LQPTPFTLQYFPFQSLISNELSTNATILQLSPYNLYKSKSSPSFEKYLKA